MPMVNVVISIVCAHNTQNDKENPDQSENRRAGNVYVFEYPVLVNRKKRPKCLKQECHLNPNLQAKKKPEGNILRTDKSVQLSTAAD